ncbi:MAG: UvrD-helicase domain-containing protein [Chlorobi bacterium]|nr:UvrD-helicase domain-containing protein [Chlorobiota bacterium]
MSFSVYKSSAGSGKTYTLVREYLKITLLSPKDFRRVLAITFTNKAANEMKQRILSSLQDISDFENKPKTVAVKFMLPELVLETSLDKNEIALNAGKCLQLILHNYSDFGVSTIDSFVHKIIKTFAHDMHLPLNFEVEMDTDEMIVKVVDILISNVGTDKALTDVLVNFVRHKTEGDKSWHIEGDLADISKEILTEDGQQHIGKLRGLSLSDFGEIREKLEFSVHGFEAKTNAIGKKAFDLISGNGLEAKAFFQGARGIYKYFESLANRKFDKIEPNNYVKKTIDEDKWVSGKADPGDISAIESIKTELISAYLDLGVLLEKEYPHYLVRNEVLKNLYPLALLNEIEKVLEEYKTDNEIVHISEFNKRIAEIVLKEPVPFIYERMGERYKHFMLDEFQDTSVLQWLNLLPLIDNSLAEDNFNMLVGDGKQAIYRWRGGEVEQFSSLPKIINKDNDPLLKEREHSLERGYKPETLSSNFRSKAEIVEFNNDFFRVISGDLPENLQVIYENQEQKFNSNNTGGSVQLKFIATANDESSFEDLNLQEILSTIYNVKEDGYGLKDVAILCRDNKKASVAATHLLQNNINVVSSESLLLENSPEVRVLFAIVKCLLDQSDYIAQVEVVSYLKAQNAVKGELHELIAGIVQPNDKDGEIGFWKLLRSNGFDFRPNLLLGLPAYDLFEELVRNFRMNSRPDPYLQFLLDAVLAVSAKKFQGLSEILEWWEKKKQKLSIVVPEGVDAVRVMTIHKAKGLEFPVVIYPFANEKQRNSKDRLWVDIHDNTVPELTTGLINVSERLEKTEYKPQYREEVDKSLLDLINLLYVTLTRPTDRLYIFSAQPPAKKPGKHSIPQFFKQYLLEKGMWDENQDSYHWGETTRKKKDDGNAGQQNDFSLEEFVSVPWRKRMLLSLQAPEHWDVDNVSGKAEYGSLVHLVLSKIITMEDVPNVMEQLIGEGVVNEDEAVAISGSIREVLQKPETARFFKKGLNVKTEAGILDMNGKSHRPDRLVFYENETAVIDFKTGKREEKHRAQLQKYKDLLLQMNYNNVKGFLLYLNEENGLAEV